jgi:acyl-CoA synthetase (NDP forming)/RimJ/RimL family protein N-acetyltransferase
MTEPADNAYVESTVAPYPAHWEADVVLTDGGTAHVRPIVPRDAPLLEDFHTRLSERTIYYRFFSAKRKLSEQEVRRFTMVDYDNRVALVALIGGQLIGVARYDRLNDSDAEVAFVIEDAHQGRGIGSVLLEHLAAAARERGVRRFVAEVLAENRQMIRVFTDAGYSATRAFESGTVSMAFPIEPTSLSVEVAQAREHRAEYHSVERLLHPRSVAVVGASRRAGSLGRTVLESLVDAGFPHPIYAVNPQATEIAGVPAFPSVRDLPDTVDLAVVCTPGDEVLGVVTDCAAHGVLGLVVISDVDVAQERRLAILARAGGMRVVGPSAFGIADTGSRLNATLSRRLPDRGPVGLFSQSGALGIALLEAARLRGIGLSSFVSAGRRADVSGNDLLQFFEEDENTSVVLLWLETFGNPRKFVRLARRIGRKKPVVVLRAGRTPMSAAVHQQAGIISVETPSEMLDVAAVLAEQPLPAGRRVGVVSNSAALIVLAQEQCAAHSMPVSRISALRPDAEGAAYKQALDDVISDPDVDAVLTIFQPPLVTTGKSVATAIGEASRTREERKPVVASFFARVGVRDDLGRVPSYGSPVEAIRALARAVDYAEWRRRELGTVPVLAADTEQARALVQQCLRDGQRHLDQQAARALLAAYNIEVWPMLPAPDPDAAVAAADALGWPVALKATHEGLRHRADLGGVRLDLLNPDDLRTAWQVMSTRFGPEAGFVVQAMAAPGVVCVVESREDAAYGPVVSFGLGGVATDLLGDLAFRAVPLTDIDVAEMVAEPHAAPLLFGYRGAAPVAVEVLEDLLVRVGRLADDLPEVARLSLNPVVVAEHRLAVLSAEVELAEPARPDIGPRRLR